MPQRAILHSVSSAVGALWCIVVVGCAFAEANQCAVSDDLFDWRKAGPPKPPPPEKTVPPISPPKDNAATVADVTKTPFRSMGKFLSAVDNERRYCTAQYVESSDLLLTAAHCVRNKNGVWLDQFEFTPSNTTKPEDVVRTALCFATKSNWVAPYWFWPADYAFVLLKNRGSQGFLRLGLDASEAAAFERCSP
jgi:hypothetical protein